PESGAKLASGLLPACYHPVVARDRVDGDAASAPDPAGRGGEAECRFERPAGTTRAGRWRDPLEGYFHTDDLREDLRRRSVRAGLLTFVSIGGRFALVVGSTMILARLLTPRDFGLVAMVASVTGFVAIVRDFGLSTAAVQSERLDHPSASSLFWVNVFVALSLAILTALAAPLIARIFREPKLTAIGVAMGGLTFIEGLAAQHQALLRRRMRFGALTACEVGSLGAGVVAAVILAHQGARYWSLVLLRFVAASVQAALLWSLCRWRPSATFRFEEVRAFLGFGGRLTASRFVRYISRNADRFLVGRVLGAGVLGLYSKACGWLAAPFQLASWPVGRVAVPVLSRLQGEPARFRTYFRTGLAILASLGVPVIVFFFIDASEVILLLLGPQWTPAIPIFRLLAPVALAALFQMGFHWCFVSLGRADRQLRWELVSAAVTVAAFAVGLGWGAVGVAAAYSVASLLLLPPGVLYCFRGTPLRPVDLLHVFGRPAAGSLGAAGVLLLFKSGVRLESLPAAAVLHALLFGIGYAALWVLLPGGNRAAREYIRIGREFRG
ncbi:MAG: lipopolysaccharide biosynthesis protein, partial [Candidatus Eisenbacteria bacterium]